MKRISTLLIAAALTACGGGGGSSSPTPAPAPAPAPTPAPVVRADGLYLDVGTARLQKVHFIIFGDLVMGLTGSVGADGGMTRPDGLLAGVGSQANGQFSSNVNYYSSNPTGNGTLTGAYTAAGAFDGTLTIKSQAQAITAHAPSAATYNYNVPASAADISGNWTMGNWQVQIDSSGLTTGTNFSEGCTLAGFLAPDKAKNVFASALKVSCTGISAQLTGLGATYLLSSGKRQLLITGLETSTGVAQGFAGVR